MIQSLLPGFRHIRAPLFAGALWLLAAWVLVAPHIPPRSELTGGLKTLTDLGDAAGSAVVLGAASVAAYLVGSLAEPLTRAILSPLQHTAIGLARQRKRLDADLLFVVERRFDALNRAGAARTSLLANLRSSVAERGDGWPVAARRRGWLNLDEDQQVFQEVRDQIRSDLTDVKTRLLGKDRDFFAEVDRTESEWEFRQALVLPIAALAVALTVEGSHWWLLLLIPATLLYYDAQRRRLQMQRQLATALGQGRAEAAILEELRVHAEAEIKRGLGTATTVARAA